MQMEQDTGLVPISEDTLEQVSGGADISTEEVHRIFSGVRREGIEYSNHVAKREGTSVKARLFGSVTRTGMEFGALAGGLAIGNAIAPKKQKN